jgi:hypothetical protein
MVKRRVTGQLTKVICCHRSQPVKNVLPMVAIEERNSTIEGGEKMKNNSQERMYPGGVRLGEGTSGDGSALGGRRQGRKGWRARLKTCRSCECAVE